MRRELTLSIGAALIAGAMLYAGSGHDYADAYIFPNLIAWIMLGLALLMIASLFVQRSEDAEGNDATIEWTRLLPVLVILPVYVVIAESVGFFIASLLAFFSISRVYALSVPDKNVTVHCLIVSLCFLAVLYLLFVVMLQVPLPTGWLI